MASLRSSRRGVSSIISMMVMLTLLLLTVASVVSLETTYQSAIVSHGQLVTEKRLENFILVDAFPDGSKVQLMNRGPIAIQIVSIYINNILTTNVTSCQVLKTTISPCVISPADPKSGSMNLAWIATQSKLKYGDIITAASARGNRATAIFPIGKTGFSGSSNLYAGSGPLTIIFAPGSFNYTGTLPNGTKIITPKDAWAGVPANTTNTMFYMLIVNHGLGDILLQSASVLYMNYITWTGAHPPSNTAQFCIADASSTATSFVQYNPNSDPYIIPDNAAGDLAVGGPPVLVKFAGTGGSSCTSNSPSSHVLPPPSPPTPVVAAVLLGMVYTWNGNGFSQDIPFATLVLLV